ncbi:MAG: hypothetical protein AAF465_02430 [Pseudomonadota bacterium]
MRRTVKFLHTVAGMGLAGGLAVYIGVLHAAPDHATTIEYAGTREALAFAVKWIILPSMLITVVSGLIAMIVHPPFMDTPWVWVKALTGLLFFEATLASLDAPAQQAAAAMAQAVAGEIDPETLAELVRNEWGAWYMLLGLSIANVALGIWRPRFAKRDVKKETGSGAS